MPGEEKPKEDWYDFDVICMHCKEKIGTKRDNDPKKRGIPSHGICNECLEKHYPKDDESKEE